jgi:hypothetical protein
MNIENRLGIWYIDIGIHHIDTVIRDLDIWDIMPLCWGRE